MLLPSPTEGRPGRFQALAVMDRAARNVHVQVFVWAEVSSSSEKIPKTAIAEPCGVFNFVRKRQAVFQVAAPHCAPTSNELLLVAHWPLVLSASGFGHSDRCTVASHGACLW